MNLVTLCAHFDGERIALDDPFEIEPNTELVITVLSQRQFDEEREVWFALTRRGLEAAYGDDEPDYDAVPIKEAIPEYEGR